MPERQPPPQLTVADVFETLDHIAPFEHAEDWDNVGLLAGKPDQPIRRLMLALDLTDAVAQEALRQDMDALVVYHPPIFKGIRSVTAQAQSPTGRLPDLLAAGTAILATHTAFDVAQGGINDLLLDIFEPITRRPLETIDTDGGDYKLVVFVPPTEVERLRTGLSAAGAGVIGHYSECGFELVGRGTFFGDGTTNPAVGHRQVCESVEEIRLEMVVPRQRIGEAVRVLHEIHSYEEPAYDIYPLRRIAGRGQVGPGRVGKLKKPQHGKKLLRKLAKHVDMAMATSVGKLNRTFSSITVGVGAFGVRRFCDPDSLAITGEFKHHDALELLRRNITAVCLGHYASERMGLANLRDRLRRALKKVKITISRADRSPFQPVRL